MLGPERQAVLSDFKSLDSYFDGLKVEKGTKLPQMWPHLGKIWTKKLICVSLMNTYMGDYHFGIIQQECCVEDCTKC